MIGIAIENISMWPISCSMIIMCFMHVENVSVCMYAEVFIFV